MVALATATTTIINRSRTIAHYIGKPCDSWIFREYPTEVYCVSICLYPACSAKRAHFGNLAWRS